MPAYVGADRRQPVVPGRHVMGGRLVLLLMLATVTVFTVLDVFADSLPSDTAKSIVTGARTVAASLFLGAGCLRLARWRVTGEAPLAWRGVALLLMGAALPLAEVAAPLVGRPEDAVRIFPAARAILLLPVLVMLVIATLSRPVRSDIHPGRVILGALVAMVGALGAAKFILAPGAQHFLDGRTTAIIEAILMVAWASVGCSTLRVAFRIGSETTRWCGWALVFMAASEACRTSALGTHGASNLLATGLQLTAAALVLTATATELLEMFFVGGTRTLRLAGALDDTRRAIADIEAHQQERLHDARSVILGLQGASRLLTDPGASATVDPQRIRLVMTSELDRLEAILDSEGQEERRVFDVAEQLRPLVQGLCFDGIPVTDDLRCALVLGRPRTTSTVVANLIMNARAHAGSGAIVVRTRQVGDEVRIEVLDDGPGIPVAERHRVLLRGHRGSATTAAGSGLGLFTAARAMRDQGGRLVLEPREPRGTAAIVTLPAAESPQPSNPPWNEAPHKAQRQTQPQHPAYDAVGAR